jgi:hypothetical protein
MGSRHRVQAVEKQVWLSFGVSCRGFSRSDPKRAIARDPVLLKRAKHRQSEETAHLQPHWRDMHRLVGEYQKGDVADARTAQRDVGGRHAERMSFPVKPATVVCESRRESPMRLASDSQTPEKLAPVSKIN